MLEEMRTGPAGGQHPPPPPPPPPPSHQDDSQSHMERASHLTGKMQPYFEPAEDRYERKQGEFDRLVQDSMIVDEYLAKFNELVKFEHFRIIMPTPTFLASKFRRGLNEEITDRIAGAASRDFGTLVQQCRDIEDVCIVSKAKRAKVADVKGTGSSTSWKDRKFGGKGKGKQLAARLAPRAISTRSSI
ncbi:uncharacterized protein LOC133316750 [Gastrolobium bilobum]|uniref:uncharacterized protein LOC133316750 n=1 Tax=Gastrolobium bilobum TaxID=150636 RepID=UPI002AB26845|nr:uncharacterized protein LOC133316750 [Gastrolobium bilobum]